MCQGMSKISQTACISFQNLGEVLNKGGNKWVGKHNELVLVQYQYNGLYRKLPFSIL